MIECIRITMDADISRQTARRVVIDSIYDAMKKFKVRPRGIKIMSYKMDCLQVHVWRARFDLPQDSWLGSYKPVGA